MTPDLSIAAFARELGCSTATLRRHWEAGRLEAVDLGAGQYRSLYVPGHEVERVRREGLRKPATPKLRAIQPPRKRRLLAEMFGD